MITAPSAISGIASPLSGDRGRRLGLGPGRADDIEPGPALAEAGERGWIEIEPVDEHPLEGVEGDQRAQVADLGAAEVEVAESTRSGEYQHQISVVSTGTCIPQKSIVGASAEPPTCLFGGRQEPPPPPGDVRGSVGVGWGVGAGVSGGAGGGAGASRPGASRSAASRAPSQARSASAAIAAVSERAAILLSVTIERVQSQAPLARGQAPSGRRSARGRRPRLISEISRSTF